MPQNSTHLFIIHIFIYSRRGGGGGSDEWLCEESRHGYKFRLAIHQNVGHHPFSFKGYKQLFPFSY